MIGTEITFHNKTAIKVQAQIFNGRTLLSTCLAGPGEMHTLPDEAAPYDVYFKDGATGWKVARDLDSEAKSFTLSKVNGRYMLT